MKLKKYIIMIFSTIFLISTEMKASEECFEGTSRSIFKFNMVIDDAIIGPIAKGYNKLPEPIKNGTGNFTLAFSNNMSSALYSCTFGNAKTGNFVCAYGHNTLQT